MIHLLFGERRIDSMNKVYRSPYEAYPFLSDSSEDLECDFELLTDEISSRTGLLLAHMKNHVDWELYQEVLWVCELIYHINPSLRTFLSITVEECNRLKACVDRLQMEIKIGVTIMCCLQDVVLLVKLMYYVYRRRNWSECCTDIWKRAMKYRSCC